MTGYSHKPTVVNAARRFLVGCVDLPDEKLPTYGDVAESYGGIARAVGPVLNSIRRECDAEDAPDLTALVVDKATRLPGTFRGGPVPAGSANETQWRDELARVRRHDWSSFA